MKQPQLELTSFPKNEKYNRYHHHNNKRNDSTLHKILLLTIISILVFFDGNSSTTKNTLAFPSCHASSTFSSSQSSTLTKHNHHSERRLPTKKSPSSIIAGRQKSLLFRQQLRGGASSDQGRSSWSAGSTRSIPSRRSSTTTSKGLRNANDEDKRINEDKEMTKEMMNAFLKRDDRQKFIARVYSIVSCQLITTSIFVFLFGKNPSWRYWILMKGRIVPLLSLAISTICFIALSSSLSLRRSGSKSFQLLALFTICESIAVGFITSFYKFQSVISAMLLTACSTLSITMYTLMQKNPKWDLSLWGSGLSSCAMIFLVYGIIHLLELYGILPRGFLPYSETTYCLVGACLFSFFLAYDTRLIVSGKYTKIQMNEKDYVMGAMCIYMDIINIFIYLLRILGEDKD